MIYATVTIHFELIQHKIHTTKLHVPTSIYTCHTIQTQFLKPIGASKTSVVNRSFDEMGNVMWHQEAAEFVEQYPQRRRPKTAALLLRQSASAGTLYRKPETVIPSLNKRASGGELLTPQHRHQRDMFSGDLGIPDVNSHVGSVVHTFETMAMQRQMAERQRIQREREHSKYLVELLAMQSAAAAAIAASTNTSPASQLQFTPPTSSNHRSFIPGDTNNVCNSSKMQQLKKKTHETRQKIVQHILQQNSHHRSPTVLHKVHPTNTKKPNTPRHIVSGQVPASSNSEVYYRNIDDDYRKNLFGTLNQTKIISLEEDPPKSNDIDSNSYCEDSQIVNQAFDEIFEGYSGLDEDEDIKETQTDSLVPQEDLQTNTFMNQYGRPGLTPKKLPPLSHKKGPPPPPPASAGSSSGQFRRKIMPFSENKQRSSTFHNLMERLKTPPRKYATPHKHLSKTSSDILLKTDQLQIASTKYLQKFPPHLHLNREVEGQESPDNQDQDFLRGSTLSQSFVKHMKVHKPSKGKAPPIPQQTQSAKHQFKTSEALRQVLLFSKKSKSSGELLPHCDEYSTVEPRKYYRRLEELEQPAHHELNTERFIDGASMLASIARSQQTAEI